jgi:hypothetical protein
MLEQPSAKAELWVRPDQDIPPPRVVRERLQTASGGVVRAHVINCRAASSDSHPRPGHRVPVPDERRYRQPDGRVRFELPTGGDVRRPGGIGEYDCLREPAREEGRRRLGDVVGPTRSTTLEKLDEGRDAVRVRRAGCPPSSGRQQQTIPEERHDDPIRSLPSDSTSRADS